MSTKVPSEYVGEYEPSSLHKYSFPMDKIPRLSVNDPEVLQRMKNSVSWVIFVCDTYILFRIKSRPNRSISNVLVFALCNIAVTFVNFQFNLLNQYYLLR